MNILMTGASGRLGTQLSEYLIQKKNHLFFVQHQNKIRLKSSQVSTQNIISHSVSINELRAFIKKNKITLVLHLATCYVREHVDEDIEKMVAANLLFGSKLLQAIEETSVKNFIFTSTHWAYDKKMNFSSVNLYAAQKNAFYQLAQFYAKKNFLQRSHRQYVQVVLSDILIENDNKQNLFYEIRSSIRSNKVLKIKHPKAYLNLVAQADVLSGFDELFQVIKNKSAKSKDNKPQGCVKNIYFLAKKNTQVIELLGYFKNNFGLRFVIDRSKNGMLQAVYYDVSKISFKQEIKLKWNPSRINFKKILDNNAKS